MAQRRVFVSGFGPFERVAHNSSAELAAALASSPPSGLAIHGEILPVSFDRSAEALKAALAGRDAQLLVGLGEQPRHGFRLELRAARGAQNLSRPDVDGVPAGQSAWSLEPRARWNEDLWTPMQEQLKRFEAGRSGWMRSVTAGGYVCERVFRWLLEEGQRRGIAAIFVHLPPLAACGQHEQLEALSLLLSELEF